jgi:hydrogenase 3 maturation protease
VIPSFPGKRVAVIGIGNELNGDDAAGVLVARSLELARQKSAAWRAQDHQGKSHTQPPAEVLVIDAGPAPENFTGPLRRFQPDAVVLVDAAQLAQAPGAIAWVAWQDVAGFSASTHILPPSIFAQFLTDEIGCQVVFVGIQPETLEFDQPVSLSVGQAVKDVTRQLCQILAL